MHQRTMDALIKLQKQVNIDKESKNDVASMGDVYDALLSGELKAPEVEWWFLLDMGKFRIAALGVKILSLILKMNTRLIITTARVE